MVILLKVLNGFPVCFVLYFGKTKLQTYIQLQQQVNIATKEWNPLGGGYTQKDPFHQQCFI